MLAFLNREGYLNAFLVFAKLGISIGHLCHQVPVVAVKLFESCFVKLEHFFVVLAGFVHKAKDPALTRKDNTSKLPVWQRLVPLKEHPGYFAVWALNNSKRCRRTVGVHLALHKFPVYAGVLVTISLILLLDNARAASYPLFINRVDMGNV